MTRFLPGVIAMAIVVVASNILVQYHLGAWVTWGAISYPFAFLVTDVMNRVYGPAAARRVVLVGFVIGVICSLIAAGLDKTTLRIAIASGAAFLLAQLLDITVFNAMRNRGGWWTAPALSSFVGSALDTALFFSIAFAAQLSFIHPAEDVSWANEMIPLLGTGPVAPVWASLAVADWIMKLLLALLSLVPFRLIVHSILRRQPSF
ncbi:queuosine precursor transporter [Paracoccus aerodenitrificans]|uniref:queuosine precursor transporter n=1 Tax=Paracoccus aerodenitrificans TaxID=3017781 RepID=UPI0022F01CF4|nr:queuosine precursor transporter [Paracoccus aerodenitrificans]WBU63713.1 queuosine precursor transporter [Paracoccus aerodenitrificans]